MLTYLVEFKIQVDLEPVHLTQDTYYGAEAVFSAIVM